jgi:hypothetical protein
MNAEILTKHGSCQSSTYPTRTVCHQSFQSSTASRDARLQNLDLLKKRKNGRVIGQSRLGSHTEVVDAAVNSNCPDSFANKTHAETD